MKTIKILLIFLFGLQISYGTSLTFTFSNGIVTNNGVKKYEFDVMVSASDDTTRLGDAMVYINYNTLGFGSSVVANSKITVEKGTLIQGELVAGLPLYEISNISDNTSSRFAVGIGYKYSDSPTAANLVTTSPEQLLHIAIEIMDSTQTAGLSFEQTLMEGQQYKSDNATKYSPIVATDTDDSPLKTNPSDITRDGQFLPDKFQLYNNFPNPFNPSTTLKFDLPKSTANVQLVIYDILGRRIATLFSGDLTAGRYSYLWNGRNQFGNAVPSGVYFATFKAGNYSRTIKMMLVK
ncbi:MAG: T9SS type A sorting domain-containing protein [Calditrichaeota bacterium]|nr:T9SS type A sorting domain-containing protein [Calditrichota bacterium]